MEKTYIVCVVDDDFSKGLISEDTIKESNLESFLKDKVPNCTLKFSKIFNDKRCRYFRHYMPANETIAQNSYKKDAQLFHSGNRVKVYVSERFC